MTNQIYTPPAVVELGVQHSSNKVYNLYWGIDYSFIDNSSNLLVTSVNSAELDTDRREYRIMPITSFQQICDILHNPAQSIPDVIVVGDDFKLISQSRQYLAEKKQENAENKRDRLLSIVQKILGKKQQPDETVASELEQNIDYLRFRLSDPKKYCDGIFKSVMEQTAELSELLSDVNPHGKIILYNNLLIAVADEKFRRKMIDLYEDIISEIKQKYDNVHVVENFDGSFFNDQIVEQSLIAIDELLDSISQ